MQTSSELTDHQVQTLRYTPFARSIARGYHRRTDIPLEDLEQISYVGLLNAISHFDPARSVKFETYARHMIAGEIRHFIRDQRDLIRRPRRLYELNHRVRRAVETLRHRKGRRPTISEIAEVVDADEDEVWAALEAHESLRFVSLDDERDGDDGVPMPLHEGIADRRVREPENAVVLNELIAQLPQGERRVVFLYYFRGMVQTEIAAEIGISQKQVSRLLRAGVLHLRTMMTAA